MKSMSSNHLPVGAAAAAVGAPVVPTEIGVADAVLEMAASPALAGTV